MLPGGIPCRMRAGAVILPALCATAAAAAHPAPRDLPERVPCHAMPCHSLLRPQAAAASELDPEYKMALARTRQATAIHRAIGFLNTGERARCVGL